jgi:putative transposase
VERRYELNPPKLLNNTNWQLRLHVEGELLGKIRLSVNKGPTFGYDRFKKEIEKLMGRRLKTKKVGRPTR